MSHDISALRAHLFDAIAGVKAGSLDLDKARAVNELGKTLVDSAKVEEDYIRATNGGSTSTFLEPPVRQDITDPAALPSGVERITRHRLAG